MDLIGGRAKKPRTTVESRQAILDAERVLIDEDRPEALKAEGVPLEHYEDGYPKLPACLDRRVKLAEAERPGTSDARSRKGWAPGLTMPLQRSILAAGYTKNQVPEASVPKRSNP